MLFSTSTHTIGPFHLMISSGGTPDAHSENSRDWSDDSDDEDEVSAPSVVSSARQALGLNTSGPRC
jgi:hypothetical protein